MIGGLLIALLTLNVAQGGKTSEESATYIIELEDGGEVAVFWDEKEDKGRGMFRVKVDEPWAPREINVKESRIGGTFKESPKHRERRLRKGWGNAGYAEVRPGVFVIAADAELARRAREMVRANAAPDVPVAAVTPVASPPPVSPHTTEVRSGTSPARWGARVAVIIAVVGLVAFIARTMLFAEAD